jgi:hypothetical protein
MAESTSKEQLMAVIQESRAALEAVLTERSRDLLPPSETTEPWSVTDLLAHLTWWEQWLLRVLQGDTEAEAQLARFRSPDGQALVDALNATTYQANHARPLPELRATARTSFQQVLQTLTTLPESTLTAFARVIAANTFEHYDEHRQQVDQATEPRLPPS